MNRARLCMLVGRSRQQVDRWVIEGCPVAEAPKNKGGEWKFNTAEVFDWLEIRGEDAGKVLDLNDERARLAKEQADTAALKNAQLRGDLLPAEEVIEGWQMAISRARALFLGIPIGAVDEILLLASGDDAENRVRSLLSDRIDAALSELAHTEADDGDEEQAVEPDAA